MRPELIPLLVCPLSREPLVLEGQPEPWIETGSLLCPASGRRYPIRNGLPYLYIEDELWQPKAQEAAGWMQYHRDRGEGLDDGEVDFQLPYIEVHVPHWEAIAREFDIALELVRPQPGQWVLDV